MDNEYDKTKVYMAFVFFTIIGGLNWGAKLVNMDFIKLFADSLNEIFKSNIPFDQIIYLIITFSTVLLAIRREFWLPFLGKSILPDNLMPIQTPKGANKIITINTKPNTKIAYWAALPGKFYQPVDEAYGNYTNSGVALSDAKGVAKLEIIEGSGYKVPSGKTLERHVHYRLLGLPYAMMSPIYSVKY
jgi:hypothetical protein